MAEIKAFQGREPTHCHVYPNGSYNLKRSCTQCTFSSFKMLYRISKRDYIALFMLLVYALTRWCSHPRRLLNNGQTSFRERPSTTSIGAATITTSDIAQRHLTATAVEAVLPINRETSPYAFIFYATQDSYACSVLVNIRRLQDVLHTKHRIFVLISHDVALDYVTIFKQLHVTVSVQKPPELANGSAWYYQNCLLKLFAFKMHLIDPSLKKVIALDSDQLILRNLDHLFASSIDVDLTAPRSYWINKNAISSTSMLIQLSDRLWYTVEFAMNTVIPDR